MTSNCPDCGSTVEYTEREVRLRTGTCSSCGHEFTFLAGASIPVGVAARTEAEEPSEEAEVEGPPGPECAECGSTLLFRARSDGSLEASCPECETSTEFVPREEAGFRSPRRGGTRDERGPSGGARGRPCRQCGAPLRFSTNEEGLLVGECDSCGNKFTLPPRDREGRGSGGDRRFRRPGEQRYGPSRGEPAYVDRRRKYERRSEGYASGRGGDRDSARGRRRKRRAPE